ncbi:hypothetical protein [Polaribacter staleyi]|uniref:hypothetical protein n=1 Tax=Polaribacter staleyi TaxID=2022337 RepID=UPI0031BAF502
MKQNNLDKLFQEQLDNLEATPNKRVWNNIESKLKKKKRRVVPFWWFASGIAAMLLLGLFLFPFSDDKTDVIKTDSKIIITESPKKELEIMDNSKVDAVIKKETRKEEMFVVDKKLNASSIKPKRNTSKNTENKNNLVSTKNAMKKNFLADKFTKITEGSVKNKQIILDENNVVIAENKNTGIEKKVTQIDKESPKNKVDLNKFIEKKDSVFSVKSLKKKWSIAPVFAVLKSNSFSSGSPINEHLSNSTKGKSSFSYGFKIGYQITERWSIQSGVHLQEMGFKNNQVTAVPSISKSSLPVVFNNGDSFSFNEMVTQNSDLVSNSSLDRTSLHGDLNQNYGYIEIPVEVKYNFLNTKKFNTQLVMGFSSLFLNKNAVNFSTSIISTSGKSNNLNNINFSGNLGFDFNYSLNKKWSLNLNPMFKAQLHTFSQDVNGFSPFNLGVYSGIKYKF